MLFMSPIRIILALLPSFAKWKSEPDFDFHNDESLHDGTTIDARPWYSNLVGDALAIVRAIPTFIKHGKEQGFKHIASALDLEDPLSKFISKHLVQMLWGSLLHPPMSYRGDEYRYRMPDGSNNSALYPHLGRAGVPYARSVAGKRPLHGTRPDPSDLFDMLMARKDEGKVSESGISMMLLYHASVIIHDIFRTDDYDSNASATSAYLDLAPLYGSDRKTQESVRLMRDGLLKPDTFAETRLLNQPPGVCIYIIMYNRFHNYVAKQLKEIDEHGRFSLPPGVTDTPEDRKIHADVFEAQDEHLFQTARLVTCGLYINAAIHDYLRCLMGVHASNTPWTLDPTKALPEKANVKGLDRGEGNMVSAEFNLLYRFHSPISRRDTAWSEELFVKALKFGKSPAIDDSDTEEAKRAIEAGEKVTTQMVRDGEVPFSLFKKWLDDVKPPRRNPDDPAPNAKEDYFPLGLDRVVDEHQARQGKRFNFTRNRDHYFDDAQLAAEMCRAMEDPICQFGAQQTPKIFKAIEIMGILQARKWEVATLNEYREFFGLSRFKSFAEINSEPEIQQRLRDLYEDPDLIEFYPGLFCEGQGRDLDPGTANPGGARTSLWRGVFSDAVTLVRSDRFYTLDWNVESLTSWGMKEVSSDPTINKGSVLHRLFQRAFPRCFEYNSVHMWQPFYTPQKNILLAKEQGYLNWLDLTGLEDDRGNPHIFSKVNNETLYGRDGERCVRWQKIIKESGVRKTLQSTDPKNKWRGGEKVIVAEPVERITSYNTIRKEILGGPNSNNWANQVILEPTDIPDGPLRLMMTKKRDEGWEVAVSIVKSSLPKDWEQIFMDYFVELSQDIRLREQRKFQMRRCDQNTTFKQSYQLDIVKGLAIPVVTRFIADLIGFWDDIKTPEYKDRPLTEHQIYTHIENCQNFEAYDADPTKTWKRRMAFQKSIRALKMLAEKGVSRSRCGWSEDLLWCRSYGSAQDGEQVRELRKVGVSMTRALLQIFNEPIVASIMLQTALEAAQRFVLTFTEVVAWFIDPEKQETGMQTDRWSEFVKLAWQDTEEVHGDGTRTIPKGKKNDKEITELLKQYVLEAARLSNSLDLVCVYEPTKAQHDSIQIDVGKSELKTIKKGDVVLLEVNKAYHHPSANPNLHHPSEFKLRDPDYYIGLGPTVSPTDPTQTIPPRFSKQATLIGLTALLKSCAHLSDLRAAHGRLKRVTTPDGFHRYPSAQWDQLLPYPSTWTVRYDGIGFGDDDDDTVLGHGQGQPTAVVTHDLWKYQCLWGEGSNFSQRRERARTAEIRVIDEEIERKVERSIRDRVDGAVKRAVDEAMAKAKVTVDPEVDWCKVESRVVVTEVEVEVDEF